MSSTLISIYPCVAGVQEMLWRIGKRVVPIETIPGDRLMSDIKDVVSSKALLDHQE